MYRDLAQRLRDLLHMEHRSVGLAFVEQFPENVEHTKTEVPSACTFWRLAEDGVFFASGSDHRHCPIGMMTMGFQMPEESQQQAQDLVGTMAKVQYFSPAEVSALPVINKPHEQIVYGRLDAFPIEPDVILSIVDAQQAMLIAEALGDMNWLQPGELASFGRPTCAVIPRTLQTGKTSLSFGCVGARTYVGLKPGELVITLLPQAFTSLVERLETIVQANNALAPYHQGQKVAFPA